MKFSVKQTINENIITATITVVGLGSNTLTEEQERNLISDFPRSVEFAKIKFSAPMKIGTKNLPIIADENDADAQLVEIKELVNQIIPIDETFIANISFNVGKISKDELGSVFTTQESLGKAKTSLFYLKIREEIERLIEEMRNLNDEFEGEEEFSV